MAISCPTGRGTRTTALRSDSGRSHQKTGMAGLGRLQPFVAVTQSIAFAMPAKGSLRPETVIHWDHAQGPLPDQKADNRANRRGAQ